MRLIGELIEVIAERAGLRNVRDVGEQLKRRHDATDAGSVDLPGRSAGVADVLGSDVLDLGQLVIAAMKATTGDGDPDTGKRFGHGHSAFSKSGETLRSATADDDWDGAAARAYADQNTRQQLRTETMAAADLEVHRVLFREAAQITLRRGFLDDQSNFLAYTSYATFPLQFIRTWGEAAKLAIELKALQAALGESAYQMYQLRSEVNANATELQQAIGRYRSVSDGTEKPSADVDFGPPPPSPGGDARPRRKSVGSPVPTESAAPAPRVPGPAGGIDAPSGATMPAPASSLMPAPEPSIAEPTSVTSAPPMPVAPPVPLMPVAPTAAGGSLGGLITPLAALITSAALAAAEQAEKKEEDGRGDDEADAVGGDAAAGGRGERAPAPGEPDSPADGPQTPAAVRLDPDTAPGPPPGMSPQDEK